ncbi:MAG: hypothetical protein COA42_11800 [Alteromonadaceae bacterium]|nr:MAG: hypothetical protein COA42_11800 [Alteromonadaceae bacterium]
MKSNKVKRIFVLLQCLFFLIASHSSLAHHVLGRPSYSLNEDSNTPPSMAIETQIGDYFVTYMIFPAFPKPSEPGRVNLYVTRIDDGSILSVPVSFYVLDDKLFSGWPLLGDPVVPEKIGVQNVDDGIFRQGFVFKERGSYIIRAYFEVGDEPYEIDFPLQVGKAPAVGPIGFLLGLLILLLVSVNLVQRKRIARSKFQKEKNST